MSFLPPNPMSALLPFVLELADWLATSIPKWIAAGRAKGELTAQQEAEYQARQEAIFGKEYAQPESPTPPVPPPGG